MSLFKKMSTEEKKEFGKGYSDKEKESYRKGQRNAYSHMAKLGARESRFMNNNLKNNSTVSNDKTNKKDSGKNNKR